MSGGLPDYYQVLEQEPTASVEDLKRAYLDLQKFYYPDLNTNKAAAAQQIAKNKAQQLNEAWHWLGDPERRALYDALLAEWEYEETLLKAKALGIIPAGAPEGAPPPPAGKPGPITDIAVRIRIDGFEVVDKRKQGGSLWVVGMQDLKAYFDEWRNQGYDFVSTGGVKSTKNRPAWWLRKTPP